MLRQNREIALNDVVVASLEAADYYRDSQAIIHQSASQSTLAEALSDEFGKLEKLHQSMASAVAEQIREMGDLPRQPDGDLEQIQRLANQAKVALSADELQTLLEQRIQAEQHILVLLDTALELEYTDACNQCLADCKQSVQQALDRLQSLGNL